MQDEFVHPLDLLDGKNHFYMTVPYRADPSLMELLIEKNIEGMSEKDASAVANRIDTLYVGMQRSRHSTEFQISGLVDFPRIAVEKVFSRKSGFSAERKSLQVEGGEPRLYSVYSRDGLDICLPSERMAFLGRDVSGMLEVFHAGTAGIPFQSENPLPREIYDFLLLSDDDGPCMKFYASHPQSFLTMLTGANLTLKLVYVRGIMRQDPKFQKQYRMDLEFEFKDPRMVPVARGALSVAFGLTDSDVHLESPTHLKISNIKIGKDQLYRLLIIKK